jgi:hypothetical protein
VRQGKQSETNAKEEMEKGRREQMLRFFLNRAINSLDVLKIIDQDEEYDETNPQTPFFSTPFQFQGNFYVKPLFRK